MSTKRFLTDTKYKLVSEFFIEEENGCLMVTYERYSNNKRFLTKILNKHRREQKFAFGAIFNLEDK